MLNNRLYLILFSSPPSITLPSITPPSPFMQINLSEYRNRARKPAERRSSAEKSSPPHSSVSAIPLFPTLLSGPPPLLGSSYSGSLMLGTMGTLPSSGPTPAPGAASAPSVPQFEPVSPDDGDQTPPLINMEGASPLTI